MEHMVVYRALIERAAVRYIASRRDPVVLAKLTASLSAMAKARAKHDQIGFLNYLWEFHANICEGSGNPFLLQAWNVASNLIRLYMHRAIATINQDDQLVNNRAILDAMREKTPARAEQITRGLMIKVAHILLERPVPEAVRDCVESSVFPESRYENMATNLNRVALASK